MFDRIGTFVSRHWWLVLLGWAALVVGVHLAAPPWEQITHDGDFAYLPRRMTSVQGEVLLEAAFPKVLSKSQVALIVARPDGKLRNDDFDVADRLLVRFTPEDELADGGPTDDGLPAPEAPSPVTSVFSYESEVVGRKLISPAGYHGQALLIVLRLRTELMAVENLPFLEEVHRTLDEIRAEDDFPAGLELEATGSAAVGYDYLRSAADSISNTEKTTIALVVLILLLVYRAPGLVLVPLVTIGVSVYVAKGLVAMLVRLAGNVAWLDLKVFSTTEIFIVVILFGAGTDYCLFLISRYREELRGGPQPARAISAALGRVGDALAASALTTIVGLAMMFFAEFGKFSNSGPVIALCLLVALCACVTLAPALLRATGRVVFWPFGVAPAKDPTNPTAGDAPSLFGRFWQWASHRIVARPGLILLVSLLLMAPLVGVGLNVPITYDLLGGLDPNRPSVAGTRLLHRHFLPGETGPVTVLAYQQDADFGTNGDEPEGESKARNQISRLTRQLYNFQCELRDAGQIKTVRPILSVRSLTEPFGDPPGSFFSVAGFRRLTASLRPEAIDTFVSQADGYAGKVTRFDLIFRYGPFSRQSVELLDQLQRYLNAEAADPQSPWHGAQFHFLGTTAGIRDLASVTTTDRLRIQVLVMIAVLAVLVVILRRPMICLYLVLSVLLGYFVTIGITELFFRWLYGDTFQGLDWKVPIFLFVILIAIGQDYNIYLATRVFEEQRKLGPLEGLRVAVVRTGGIITSCGLIMAGTFASMTTGTLRAMHELGFALALGVLLDTLVIRTVLVPAFLALLARPATPGFAPKPES